MLGGGDSAGGLARPLTVVQMALLVFAAATAGGRRSSCRVRGGATVVVWALWGDTIVVCVGVAAGHLLHQSFLS